MFNSFYQNTSEDLRGPGPGDGSVPIPPQYGPRPEPDIPSAEVLPGTYGQSENTIPGSVLGIQEGT